VEYWHRGIDHDAGPECPVAHGLESLTLTDAGVVGQVRGIALSSHLAPRRVSDRMASVCEERLKAAGLSCRVERVYDTTAQHAGANLAIWGESTTGCRLGADRAGALGRSSEAIGRFVAETLLEALSMGCRAATS
jgi:RNA 3'-terminal phosphate cyclase (ATP)